MSVYGDGTTVGLLWDIHQRWDGRHDRPCATFCSPNYRGGTGGHLMGLFAPSVAGEGWVKENDRVASKPYPLEAGQRLVLSGHLYAQDGTKDALTAMDRWFDLYGVIDPAPLPRGNYDGEIEFSMRAYLESLWIPEEQTFWTSRGAGPLLSPKAIPPSYEWELRKAALVTTNGDLCATYEAKADQIHELTGGAAPVASDFGFDYGGAGNWVIGTAAQVQPRAASQHDDGSWRFDADRKDPSIFKGLDYHELGPDDAAEVGTTARNACDTLLAARVTGDELAWESGLRALRHLQTFRVPRAAQVWEVPVHCPDILAAADAVDAFLEAYQYDGDEQWLEQARRWARAGLPFVYFWDDPQQPFLRYASIPVFGASWNQWSWYGRAVQWNGLRHAYALLKLSRYDDSFPWHQIGEGITRSAIHQQSTQEDDIALWPDSIGAIEGDKSGWVFEPGQILKNVYTLIGRECEPQTVIVGVRPKRLHITSGAELSDFTWDGSTLRGKLTYPSGENGITIICNVAEPEAVVADGEELPQVDNAEDTPQAAWDYRAGYALVVLRLTDDGFVRGRARGPHAIEVRGAEYQSSNLSPPAKTRVDFGFDQDIEGWLPAHAIGSLRVRDGVLVIPVTAPDPYLTRANMDLQGQADEVIVLRMRLTDVGEAPSGQFYWVTEDSPSYAEDKVVQFAVTGDGQWHEYRIEVGRHEMWAGHHIMGIRLDPFQVPAGAQAEVEWLREE